MINKYILSILALIILEYSTAQDVKYFIDVIPQVALAVSDQDLPESIDTTHYYSYNEIKEHSKPLDGWTNFYKNLDSLKYPKDAKEGKIQSLMTVGYQVNERGVLDSVFIESFEKKGDWQKCASCEDLIIDYFKDIRWNAGKIRGTPVKTTDYILIEFTIQTL